MIWPEKPFELFKTQKSIIRGILSALQFISHKQGAMHTNLTRTVSQSHTEISSANISLKIDFKVITTDFYGCVFHSINLAQHSPTFGHFLVKACLIWPYYTNIYLEISPFIKTNSDSENTFDAVLHEIDWRLKENMKRCYDVRMT